MAVSSKVGRRSLLSVLLLAVVLLCTTVLAVPKPGYCQNPIVRKEWRRLSDNDKKAYLSAVSCFLKKKPVTPLRVAPGVKNRYDDLVATHINQTFSIHYVGHFLPWHRYYTWYYENALRTECGYKGAQPYWDWTLDVGSDSAFVNSPVFDGYLGFGGNGPWIAGSGGPFEVPGRTGGGCVTNGWFKDMTVNMGPQSSVSGNPRCLSRDLAPAFARRYLGNNQTKLTMQQTSFYTFDHVVEGGPSFDLSGIHGGGHYSVGGTYGIMGDLYTSPGDPLFWLHHANLDRVWASWQKLNPAARTYDFSGPSCILDYYDPSKNPPQNCPNVTLSQPMNLGYNHPGFLVRDVMDINGPNMCYSYDQYYHY